MPPRSALVSGASIAGPVLAFWLAEAGWDVTVVERAERLRTSGYPVDVRGTAVDVIRRMGLQDALAAARYRHAPIALLTPGGRRLTTLDFGELLNDTTAGDVEISRGDLGRILYEAAADRVTYVFGDSITGIEQTDAGVNVTFAVRAPQSFDVVIGADGIHSNVRRLAFGAEQHFIRHLGPLAAIWDLPAGSFAPGDGFMYSHAGRTVVVERPTEHAPARAFLAFVHDDPGSVDTRDRATAAASIRTAFAEDRWRTADVIDTLTDAGDVYFDTVSQIRMDRWSADRVALVGDAAYAPAFLSGQGTSIAIAGAYVLASELVRHQHPRAAFEAYERRMRRYVEKNQDLALRTDSSVIARSRRELLRRNIRLSIVPLLQRLGLAATSRPPLREAATDLTLKADDLRRSRIPR
ncbi:oxidoreductase [Mycolicibacterium madagascariense]|uniref:Oxidoreductase n=1 Tax=Mycolicibacterium madagascariense TaxID=212765 RepID=A0A7I7XH70_9MYCO|nr:FAD-dependent monooxygenase [Mycolicibacterium madagascariense]MCV7014362.1 FAD-dependent monooxygenase [Mycolicibacterium madagascariense]BBZ28546.1 oxidoreductase [Mycolicibacterium madagascariense]